MLYAIFSICAQINMENTSLEIKLRIYYLINKLKLLIMTACELFPLTSVFKAFFKTVVM